MCYAFAVDETDHLTDEETKVRKVNTMKHANKIYRVVKDNEDLLAHRIEVDDVLHTNYSLDEDGFVYGTDIHVDDLVKNGYAVLETPHWVYFTHDDDGWHFTEMPLDSDNLYSDNAVAKQLSRAESMYEADKDNPTLRQAGVMCGSPEMFYFSDSGQGLAFMHRFCFRNW